MINLERNSITFILILDFSEEINLRIVGAIIFLKSYNVDLNTLYVTTI